jgi:pilus assembly protein CpaF
LIPVIFNPVEHVNYKVSLKDIKLKTDISQSDTESLKNLIKSLKIYLRDNYNDDFVQSMISIEERNRCRYYISDYIKEQRQYSFVSPIETIIEMAQKDILEMGSLQKALDDPEISSIEINSPTEVIVEKKGKVIHDKSITFYSIEHIKQTIDKMLLPMGETINATKPIVDANHNGFRINAVLDVKSGGISLDSPIVSIRKFPPDVYSHEDCVNYGNCSYEMIEFKKFLFQIKTNIIISGSVNSGKTAQLMRIPLFMNPITRILTIEDSAEMLLKHKIAYKNYPNIAAFIQKDHEQEKRRYTIPKIVKMTLRQNPDYLFIGEIRDKESAEQAVAAGNTGNGIATSLHANSDKDAAARMLQLCGNTIIAANQIAENFDILIHQENVDGIRREVMISELLSYENAINPIINPIFKYDFKRNKFEQVGKLKKITQKLQNAKLPENEIKRWCHL